MHGRGGQDTDKANHCAECCEQPGRSKCIDHCCMREPISSEMGLFQAGVEVPGEDTDQDCYPQHAPYQSESVEHTAADSQFGGGHLRK